MVKDILFVPRKKLKMIDGCTSIPGNFLFVDKRLRQCGTRLETPTVSSLEGLTSGFRSAIVLGEGGQYFRLKGVAPTRLKKNLFNGTCFVDESFVEQENLLHFYAMGESSMQPSSVGFYDLFSFGGKCFLIFPNKIFNLIKSSDSGIRALYKKYSKEDCIFGRCAISAFKISGDTRVDELFYELTKKEVSGSIKRERDNFMKSLSRHSGIILGGLHHRNEGYYSSHNATNSHLGNFVLEDYLRDECIIQLVDLGAMTNQLSQADMIYDAKEYVDEFFADYTTSHPVSLPYRHFSKELRTKCWNYFQQGYNSGRQMNIFPKKKLDNLKYLFASECREIIKKVNG